MDTGRVLHLIDSAGMYGAEHVVLTLLDKLKDSLFPGVLGCISDKAFEVPQIAEEAQKRGVETELFTMKRGFNPGGIVQILRYIKRNNIHLVHSHGYKPNIFMSVVPRRGIKVLSTVHGWSKQTASAKGKTYEFIDSLSLRTMDKIVAVSKAVFDDLTWCGVNKDKIEVIYNGIALDSLKTEFIRSLVRTEYGIPQSTYVLGAVGRLAAVKGYQYLIEAMPSVVAAIPNCKLLIAGEGSLKNELLHRIVKQGLASYITLVGYQTPISRFLSMVDVFVMPSLSEGLPIALLEAMACGNPVLASSVGGIPEVITSRKDGILLPPADSNALAGSIKELYHNQSLRANISRQGKELVEGKFSSTSMARQYLSVYSGLMQ